MFSSENWFGAKASFYNGVATQSLRFDIASSSYLKRQPSASNRKTYVVSFWVKPSKATLNSAFLAGRTGSGGTYTVLGFSASDNRIRLTDNQTSYPALETSAKYRDLSAWYHIVFAVDTTQTTTSNTIKVYVNGAEQTYATSYYYSTNDSTNINSTDDHYIGHQAGVSNLDGYLAEYNFIDGLSFFSDTSGTANSSFNINSFGETKNGIWIAKAYSGSYGTNGFRLAFNSTDFNTSGSSTMTDPHGSGTAVPVNGLADASGQGNHWTTNGISAEDFVADSPENNFPTINPLHQSSDYSSVTISEGALSLKHSNLAHASAIASMALPKSGKWYWETLNNSSATNGTNMVGLVVSTYNNSNALSGAGSYFWANGFGIYGYSGGNFGSKPSVTWDTSGSATTFTANDIIGVAYDADNKDVEWYKNGVKMDYNVTNFDDDGNILIPASSAYGNPANSGIVFNFGQDSSFAGAKTSGSAEAQDANGIGDFYYSPPSGFLTLCSANISDDTLPISPNADTQADDHFGTLTYTSDGNSVDIISGGNDNNGTAVGGEINFSPDWVWIKRRNAGNNHQIFDTNRSTNVLVPNENGDESDYSAYFNFLSSSNGFRLPATSANMNANGGTFVAWNWKANGGTPTSNSDGSITSTVQANTDAGFSIITWTGNATLNSSIGHGLNSTPEIYIIKNRDDSGNWAVPTTLIDGTHDVGYLNLSNGFGAHGVTLPTSSVVYLSGANNQNGSGDQMVMYCFHSVEGFSKFGIYEGNQDTNGTFVYTGFRPAWVMIKDADTSGYNWYMYDNTRLGYNPNSIYSLANPDPPAAETNYSGDSVDFLSNGFKLRTLANGRGTNRSVTYIYLAFAEAPFKYANAR